MSHIPVLLEETISALDLESGSKVIDCTLGEGGHAREIISLIGQTGIYIGIDADPTAIEKQSDLKEAKATVHLVCDNFINIASIAEELSIQPDAILADLGWRTDQFEEGGKGFSFSKSEPLLMTYGDPGSYQFTAADIVNEWEETSIADIIFGYGEERYSRRIAKAIVTARKEKPVKTAAELAAIVSDALPKMPGYRRIHPATKTFQALRIAVNDELGVVEKLLEDGFGILAPGGRMAIITFHSLEDRLVKRFFNSLSQEQLARKITKKPIIASEQEVEKNPRSRSAKLRVIEKL